VESWADPCNAATADALSVLESVSLDVDTNAAVADCESARAMDSVRAADRSAWAEAVSEVATVSATDITPPAVAPSEESFAAMDSPTVADAANVAPAVSLVVRVSTPAAVIPWAEVLLSLTAIVSDATELKAAMAVRESDVAVDSATAATIAASTAALSVIALDSTLAATNATTDERESDVATVSDTDAKCAVPPPPPTSGSVLTGSSDIAPKPSMSSPANDYNESGATVAAEGRSRPGEAATTATATAAVGAFTTVATANRRACRA
jgi:hypothetical protein